MLISLVLNQEGLPAPAFSCAPWIGWGSGVQHPPPQFLTPVLSSSWTKPRAHGLERAVPSSSIIQTIGVLEKRICCRITETVSWRPPQVSWRRTSLVLIDTKFRSHGRPRPQAWESTFVKTLRRRWPKRAILSVRIRLAEMAGVRMRFC